MEVLSEAAPTEKQSGLRWPLGSMLLWKERMTWAVSSHRPFSDSTPDHLLFYSAIAKPTKDLALQNARKASSACHPRWS